MLQLLLQGKDIHSIILPIKANDIVFALYLYANKEIIPEVKLVPEAQPRDTNNRGILSALASVGRKHILMARSIAKGPS